MEDKTSTDDDAEYKVEAIVDKRIIPCSGGCNGIIGCECGGRTEYRIKWLGYGSESNTWEPVKHLYCEDLIEEFEKTYARQKTVKGLKTKSVNSELQPKVKVKRKRSCDINISSNIVQSSGSRLKKPKIDLPKISNDIHVNSFNGVRKNERKKSVEFKEPIAQKGKTLDGVHKHKKRNNGQDIDPCLHPEKIIGVADSGGELMFLTKWKGKSINFRALLLYKRRKKGCLLIIYSLICILGQEKVDLVPAREANVKFTDMVVKFYEDRIQWHAGHLLSSNSSE